MKKKTARREAHTLDRIQLIASAIEAAKTRTIARIIKRLGTLSATDLQAIERLIGKRP